MQQNSCISVAQMNIHETTFEFINSSSSGIGDQQSDSDLSDDYLTNFAQQEIDMDFNFQTVNEKEDKAGDAQMVFNDLEIDQLDEEKDIQVQGKLHYRY